MQPKEALKTFFGYDSYRPGQEAMVRRILEGGDVLGIMPTGAGKSLCYQLPALVLPGITLVISPLIALMRDQVTQLVAMGVKGAYINSSLTPPQMDRVMEKARGGQYRIIYVAPERLHTPDFLDFAQKAEIAMVTVDEAHCVSQWGHDFRPGYLEIASFLEKLPRRPILSAFTATATQGVREDVLQLLGLHDPLIQVTGFDRQNLYFTVERPQKKLPRLLDFLKERREESAIVYCATRKTVEEVTAKLLGAGLSATRYHAGLDPLERQENQEDFVYERCRIMVATNAFGMGINKSNVRSVIHYNMPKNLESYYQEAGRAGRDGEGATCLLLYSPQDVRTAQLLLKNSEDEAPGWEERFANSLTLLRQMTFYATTQSCLRHFILNYFGEAAPLSCGACGNCDTHFLERDITREAKIILSCVVSLRRKGRTFGAGKIAAILKGGEVKGVEEAVFRSLSTYGLMKEYSLQDIRNLIDQLLERGLLALGDYAVLQATEQAKPILSGETQVLVHMPIVAEKDKERKKAVVTANVPDKALFGRLRALRAEIAAGEKVPAFVVFGDATLRDMCSKMPRDLEEFSQVTGVGQVKLKKYGLQFLAAIREMN